MRVLVVGGGAAGLSAAYHLAGRASVTLAEASPRLGGWVHTSREGGFLVERGPRSLRSAGEAGARTWRLVKRLGLEREVLPAAGSARFLWSRGAVRKLSEVALPALPALVANDLARALPTAANRARAREDVTLHEFLASRMGEEAGGALASAMAAGIYAGDSRSLSVRCAFPTIATVADAGGGSVIAGALRRRFLGGAGAGGTPPPEAADATAAPAVYSFLGGLGVLTDALAAEVRASGCEVRTGTPVEALRRAPGGGVEASAGGATVRYDAVLSTVTAPALAGMLEEGEAATLLRGLASYVSLDVVNMCWRRPQWPRDEAARAALGGFGFLVPSGEAEPEGLLGVAVDSSVFPEHGERGELRLTVMMGGARAPLSERPGEEAAASVARCLGALGEPDTVVANRAESAIPQFPVGFAARRAEAEAALGAALPGCMAGGATFGGVSVNDCLGSGAAMAERVLAAAKV